MEFSHNVLNLPMTVSSLAGSTVTNTMTYTYLGDGTRVGARVSNPDAQGYSGMRYRGSFVYDVTADGVHSLQSVAVSTGRLIALTGTNGTISFESDGFITDHLGNVAAVVNLSAPASTSNANVILEQDEYYPFGTKMEAAGMKNQATNRYRLAGKEEQDIAGMDLGLLDFGARYYDAYVGRWNAIDPLAHKYFGMSPYNYCGNDPVNFFDPDGSYIKVCQNEDGTYSVLGGELDDDMNIYVYTQDENGEYTVRGESIGETATPYSFYDTDLKEDGSSPKGWADGAVINPNDKSGISFLEKATDPSVSLTEYILKARGGKEWDFKLTNGTKNIKGKNHTYVNRGMPIGQNTSGKTVYASARDIGNIAAGKVAGSHGLSWELTAKGTDKYQIMQCKKAKTEISPEGPSTKYAQHLGWNMSKSAIVRQIKK